MTAPSVPAHPRLVPQALGILCLAGLATVSHSATIDIGVSTLQAQVEKAFPKAKQPLTLSEPTLSLQGVVVYTAPKFIGWAVKNLRPQDGRLQVEF
jgi:hypothetical protein